MILTAKWNKEPEKLAISVARYEKVNSLLLVEFKLSFIKI